MTRTKKIGVPLLAIVLLIGGLWCYWEWPMTMDILIPEESWVRAELRYGAVGGECQNVKFEAPALDHILPQMGAVCLTRAEKRAYLDDAYFQIILYKGEAYPTMIYVGNTGRVQIARELDFDNWRDYEGGENFYRYLKSYSKQLPAVIEVAE